MTPLRKMCWLARGLQASNGYGAVSGVTRRAHTCGILGNDVCLHCTKQDLMRPVMRRRQRIVLLLWCGCVKPWNFSSFTFWITKQKSNDWSEFLFLPNVVFYGYCCMHIGRSLDANSVFFTLWIKGIMTVDFTAAELYCVTPNKEATKSVKLCCLKCTWISTVVRTENWSLGRYEVCISPKIVRRKVSATFEERFISTLNSWQNDALQRRENTERSDAD